MSVSSCQQPAYTDPTRGTSSQWTISVEPTRNPQKRFEENAISVSKKTHVLNSLCLIGSISNLTMFFQAHLIDPSLFLFLFKIYSQQLLDFLTCAKSISPLTGKVPCLIHNPKVRAEAQDTFSSFVKKKKQTRKSWPRTELGFRDSDADALHQI